MGLNFGANLFGRNDRVSIINLTDGTPLNIDNQGNILLASGSYINVANEITMSSGAYVNMGSEIAIASGAYMNVANEITMASGAYVNMGSEITMASGAYMNIANEVTMASGSYVNMGSEVNVASGSYINVVSGSFINIDNEVTMASGSYVNMGSEIIMASGAYVNIASEINVVSGAYMNITAGNVDIDNAYISTDAEWAAKNRTEIILDGEQASSGSTTLYTVPASTILLLAYVQLAGTSVSSAVRKGAIKITLNSVEKKFLHLTMHPKDAAGGAERGEIAGTLVPSMKLAAGDTVVLSADGADCGYQGSMFGWIESV